jgi:hypothetical protein
MGLESWAILPSLVFINYFLPQRHRGHRDFGGALPRRRYGGRLHFYFSCSAVLARFDFRKKLTVMFYLEVIGGESVLNGFFEKKGRK